MMKAKANAGSNIAFIKYWGTRIHAGRPGPPLNPSLSMTLDTARTTTTVEFAAGLKKDQCRINGRPAPAAAVDRVRRVMDRVRELAGIKHFARIDSRNHFPTSAGLASSASGFAALALAACRAAGLPRSPGHLASIAILGSGSACRSLYGGYVLWSPAGSKGRGSPVRQIRAEDHWRLIDLVVIVSRASKPVSSEQGHLLARTSPLLAARLKRVPTLLRKAARAIRERDLPCLGACIEEDALSMHAVMMTSRPPLLYWEPATVRVLKAVTNARLTEGLSCYFTIDAGPNVHVITEPGQARTVAARLKRVRGVKEILACPTGPGAYLEQFL